MNALVELVRRRSPHSHNLHRGLHVVLLLIRYRQPHWRNIAQNKNNLSIVSAAKKVKKRKQQLRASCIKSQAARLDISRGTSRDSEQRKHIQKHNTFIVIRLSLKLREQVSDPRSCKS